MKLARQDASTGAVELARSGDKPVAVLAKELPISESCLRNWMAQADANGGETARSTSAEKKELAELRRRNRQLEIRVDVLLSVAASAARACTPDPSGRTTIRHQPMLRAAGTLAVRDDTVDRLLNAPPTRRRP